MTEYGVFNDEGCIDQGFWSLKEAQSQADHYRSLGETAAFASAICPDHEQQELDYCDECSG